MSTGHSFLQNLFPFAHMLAGTGSKRMYRAAVAASLICAEIVMTGFSKPENMGLETIKAEEKQKEFVFLQKMDAEKFADAVSGKEAFSGIAGGFEESGWFAEGKLRDGAKVSEIGRKLVGDILKQNTMTSLETEKAVRERVYEAQKEIRIQEREAAAREAAEERERQKEEERKAALHIPYNEQDYQVMLKIVQAEAGGCDTKGKILVANVVMNRVRSSEFPNSITGVVYEGSQFSPVIDGSIDRVKVSEDTIQCVNRALAGEDYSQGALYFMNRKVSQSGNISWFDQQLTYLFQHESHEFFK